MLGLDPATALKNLGVSVFQAPLLDKHQNVATFDFCVGHSVPCIRIRAWPQLRDSYRISRVAYCTAAGSRTAMVVRREANTAINRHALR